MAGLVGSGRTELLQAIFGLYPVQSGEFYLEGTRIFIHSLHDAMAVGIGFSPEDRRKQSLYINLGVEDNILVTTLKQVTRLGFIVRKEAARRANDFVKLLAIRTSSLDQPVINLSGGNQQKTVLARWLAIHPKVLLLDDPTAGIDAGAKHEIYKILTDLTASGVIVVLVSSELPELLGLCDRLAVMCAGRLATVLERSNFNEELVMAYAAGIRSD